MCIFGIVHEHVQYVLYMLYMYEHCTIIVHYYCILKYMTYSFYILCMVELISITLNSKIILQ